MKKFPIPTGYLFTDKYSEGKLETLSIGDYGKKNNVKADFLGYTDELDGVPSGYCEPLTEKWVVTLSTQYGCPMSCQFCDVPKVDFKGNASVQDLKDQLFNALGLFSDQVTYTGRLNIHFARMGEPMFNMMNILDFAEWLSLGKKYIEQESGVSMEVIHPVISTMVPQEISTKGRLEAWCKRKNEDFNGQAGLQLSINSTDEEQRNEMFQENQTSLRKLSEIAKGLPDPVSRKYTLNFALASDYKVNAEKLRELFNPEKFIVKITPIHNNNSCQQHNIETEDGYESYAPYQEAEQDLKEAGFDVIVFVPSIDEEDGLVTCGNAVLSGSEPKTSEDRIKIKGIDK